MKFTEMPYERIDVPAAAAQLDAFAQTIAAAPTAQEALVAYRAFEALSDHIATMAALSTARHTIDTRDAFYEAENDFYDANGPTISDHELGVYRTMLASPHRTALEDALGALAFEKMELATKTMIPEILPLMAEENALQTAYQKLCATAQIDFDGKKLTLSQLRPYKQRADRAVRKAAMEAEGAWYDANRAQLDEIYDKLVHNRTAQAKAMGYENFIPLGAIRMARVGYSLEDMRAFRHQIVTEVVPVVAQLKQLQFARTGIEDAKYYDDDFCFADGNPRPHGTPEEILAAGQQMYHALSPETKVFIDTMMDSELFDVLSKEGKAPGGYCTYLPDFKTPFIFSNFNGTAGDVDVLTHEAGHAFAAYVAAQQNLPSILQSPGMESCEIHSMAMEFLTSDYHHLFFGDETTKYALAHAEDALFFLPYGTMVDEFQHAVYANPDWTPAQRNEAWASLEKTFRPWIDFDALPFYSRGAGWQRQLHIYECPFYYIDYCLAQVVALQFFAAFLHDKHDAWQRYLALVQKAGSETYTGLIQSAGLQSPFVPGTLQNVVQTVGDWVRKADAALAK